MKEEGQNIKVGLAVFRVLSFRVGEEVQGHSERQE